MVDARDTVLSILMDIEENNTFSNIAINKALNKNQFIEKNERAFITRLSEGVVEMRLKLDYIINQFSKTKVNKCKPMIKCILRMGVYQLIFMDGVPDSAACNEAVKLAKKHNFSGLSGFVNGVLRSISRNKDNITYPSLKEDTDDYLSIEYSMPKDLVKRIKEYYPDKYMDILEGTFSERATTIRVNNTLIKKDELKKLLENEGISVEYGYYDDKALLIKDYDFIRKIYGYKKGYFTVQDESSMCAVREAFDNIGSIDDDFIAIDVCAAPGGKTTAALEYMNGRGRLYSLDISEEKLELIEENIDRLGFDNVSIACHDATEELESLDSFYIDGLDKGADLIIADLPCSGLGIMGRKNDIKYHVTKEQSDELSRLQKDILDNVCKYIKYNGILLYSTCTIVPEENEKVVDSFLGRHRDFSLINKRLFLQGVDKCDGFFYAVIRRNKTDEG
ncbi:MAG: 16S rRNA (cytosine(967)-C(5))-methyltransferase RsmB [Lachnospiraceae bacterium]|nr:16S rRNA (cytosine(967)-C(5))-methyltransferase RsmB [Lachnospiraceae bacterium]